MELMNSDYFRAFRYRVGNWEQLTPICFGTVYKEARERAETNGERLFRDRLILKPERAEDENGNIIVIFSIEKCFEDEFKHGAFCSP